MAQEKFTMNSPFHRPTHTTLTDQTVLAIQEAIRLGKFPPGSQLPPEMELLQMMGISRTTLREALRILEEQRLIRKSRGRGTFVMDRAILKDMSQNFGITEMISQAGYIPGTRDFEIFSDKASKTLAEKLRIPEDSTVVVIERVRTASDTPIVWTRDIMPQDYLGDWTPTNENLEGVSLYECLERYANIRIVEGVASFSPVQANREIAEKLSIKRNALLLLIEQVDHDQNQRPVLYSAEYHLTDKFNFMIHRKGPSF
ncbi:MAG TPA: GntR family transcriptional regulator [Anaerolineales bacterium]|jgi:GntR family transcriptional regulator|nr:GntR family transcriptional regulator [Anaerolineales bacterium]